ncbi:MAG: hypothetical protein ACTTJC_05460 [Campylobacter sp.]
MIENKFAKLGFSGLCITFIYSYANESVYLDAVVTERERKS